MLMTLIVNKACSSWIKFNNVHCSTFWHQSLNHDNVMFGDNICSFIEYVKLVEFIMVQILGNVEDERCFSMLIFMKLKLHNSDRKTSLLICHLLCACLHNGSTFCKISHMWNALNNGEEHASDIAMFARQYAFIVGHIFAKVKCVWLMHLPLLNSMNVLQAKQLSSHNTSMFCPISTIQCLQFFSLHVFFHM